METMRANLFIDNVRERRSLTARKNRGTGISRSRCGGDESVGVDVAVFELVFL